MRSVSFAPILPMLTLAAIQICLLLGLVGCCGEKGCEKTMSVTGAVTDSSTGQPLEGVRVYCCIVAEQGIVRDTTKADGTYQLTDSTHMGSNEGAKVRFEKDGYETTWAASVTAEEGNQDRCDTYTLQRNVEMNPASSSAPNPAPTPIATPQLLSVTHHFFIPLTDEDVAAPPFGAIFENILA